MSIHLFGLMAVSISCHLCMPELHACVDDCRDVCVDDWRDIFVLKILGILMLVIAGIFV